MPARQIFTRFIAGRFVRTGKATEWKMVFVEHDDSTQNVFKNYTLIMQQKNITNIYWLFLNFLHVFYLTG